MKLPPIHIALFMLTALWANAQPTGEPWMDLQVNEINRLPVHTSFIAQDENSTTMSRFLSLNGDWKFHWVANLNERPTDFWRLDLDDSTWGTMPVP
ncbi:MAG: hypothetical protein IJ879_05900, partial [Muribaculaceae bacterium]|nr:hypothetical protein [Muribaculaceae bacterium]